MELFSESEISLNSILVSELVKKLKNNGLEIRQNRFFQWLRDNGYLKKVNIGGVIYNTPTKFALDEELFEIRRFKVTRGCNKETITPLVTPKGQRYILKEISKLLWGQIKDKKRHCPTRERDKKNKFRKLAK